MLSEGSQLVNKLIFILPMFLQQKTAPIGTVYILIIFYSAIPRSWLIIPYILFRNSNSDTGANLIFRCSTYCFFLLSTADFFSNLFLAVTHLFFPRIITADFAFSLFPLSHILFSVIFSSGFYINSYSRCHFLALARSMIYFHLKLARLLDAVLNKYTIYDSRNLSSDIAKNPSAAAPAASKGSLFMFFYD